MAAGESRNGSCQCDDYKCHKILHVVVQLWIFKNRGWLFFLADRSSMHCPYCQLLSMIKGRLPNSLYRKEFSPEAEFKFDSYVLLINLP